MGDSATVIDRVDVHGYDLTYAHGDYVMSAGRIVNVLPSTVVRIRTRGGLEGFGETCPLGATYLPAFGEGARAALHELAPALIGVDAANLADVGRVMDATLRGHEYAKSAIDVACWDILGRAANQPVAMLLGGALQARAAALRRGPRSARRRRWRRSSNANGPAGSTTSSSSSATRPSVDRDRVAAVHAVDRARGRDHRRREWWLAPTGRDHRRATARGFRPRCGSSSRARRSRNAWRFAG